MPDGGIEGRVEVNRGEDMAVEEQLAPRAGGG